MKYMWGDYRFWSSYKKWCIFLEKTNYGTHSVVNSKHNFLIKVFKCLLAFMFVLLGKSFKKPMFTTK